MPFQNYRKPIIFRQNSMSLLCAKKLKNFTKFNSNAAFLYALALEKKGDVATAGKYLETFDAPYSRSQERLELSKFYIRNDKIEKAHIILQEIVTESEGMSKPSFRQNRIVINKAKELLTTNF